MFGWAYSYKCSINETLQLLSNTAYEGNRLIDSA